MKQVLLIGDSIREGYCKMVAEALQEQAEVIYPSENCRSTQYVLMRMLPWSGLCNKEDVALVHLNCGQWDAARFNYTAVPLTSVEEYERNMHSIVWVLKSVFPNAQIVLATTTPMNPEHPETCNPRTTDEIMQYNEAVIRVAQDENLPLNDLFAISKNWGAEYYIDYCHLTQEGYRQLAQKVTETIQQYL